MSGTGALSMMHAPMQLRFSAGGTTAKNSFINCPKCHAPAPVRSSKQETDLVKHLFCLCSNTGCGHTFKMELSFIYTISPGPIERDDLNLPVCPKNEIVHVLPPPRGGADDEQSSMFEDTG